jgi:hypothetical protein
MMLLRKLRNAILASIAVGICCTAAGTAMFARFPASAAPAPKAEPAPQKKPVLANAFADDPSFPYLLQNPAVIAELKLTDEQKEKIVESFVPLAKEFAMPPPIKPADLEQLKILQKVVDARIAKVFQELSKTVLTPEQLNRLCQIGLQMHGPEFYSNEKAAQILKLSDDQKKKVVVIIEDYRNANQLWLKADGGGILSPETVGRLERISKDASVKFSRLLNNHQQAIWKEFIGREVSLGKMILRNPDDEVQKPR